MYSFILPHLAKKGIDKILLEVIIENIQAIKSYERTGFKAKRELVCFEGELGLLNTGNSHVEIKELQEYNWELMEAFWDVYPTWPNSKIVLNELKHTQHFTRRLY